MYDLKINDARIQNVLPAEILFFVYSKVQFGIRILQTEDQIDQIWKLYFEKFIFIVYILIRM